MKRILGEMKIVTIVGARPQFIKAAPVSRAIEEHNRKGEKPHIVDLLVHTGQHYDNEMSAVFFRDLEIPEPYVNLGVGSGSHAWQTAHMLMRIEKVLIDEKPDMVLVYGDTNTTLAGALAAAKLHVLVAHIEAGLRSFNREMPEEHNRVLSDHLSDLLFCPTETAVKNLEREGITKGAYLVGDVMYDSLIFNTNLAEGQSRILEECGVKPKNYALATIHRAENTDKLKRLKSILHALNEIASKGLPVILPLHPRTREKMKHLEVPNASLKLIEPVSYLEMLVLEKHAKAIFTDSGGVQKEAYWFEVPCITLRNETEWVETLESNWNTLVGTDVKPIIDAAEKLRPGERASEPCGNGRAAKRIVQLLCSFGDCV